MNKRSAIALAGGTAAALVSGVAGYTLSLTEATAQATTTPDKPIVRTEVRTITIHKKPKVHPSQARGGSSAPMTIVLHRSGSSGSSHPTKPPTHRTGGSGHHKGDDGDDGHEGDGGGGDD